MINENTEVRDEQQIIPPTINQNWKQISFPGLDRLSLQTKFPIPTSNNQALTQQVDLSSSHVNYPLFSSSSCQSIHRTSTIPQSNSMISSIASHDLTLSMNLNKMKTEKSTYDNLTHSIPQLFDKTFNTHRIDDGYDNISIATNAPSKSSGPSSLFIT